MRNIQLQMRMLVQELRAIIFVFTLDKFNVRGLSYLSHVETRNNPVNQIDCASCSVASSGHAYIHTSKMVMVISCVRDTSESLHSCAGESGMLGCSTLTPFDLPWILHSRTGEIISEKASAVKWSEILTYDKLDRLIRCRGKTKRR